jgi:hypothetical protein
MILLFISLGSTCQDIPSKSDSAIFGKSDINKIASIIIDRNYFYSLDTNLRHENTLLSLDRDRMFNGLLDAKKEVSLKDSIMGNYKQELNNCNLAYTALNKRYKNTKIVSWIERGVIVGLLIKIIFFK